MLLVSFWLPTHFSYREWLNNDYLIVFCVIRNLTALFVSALLKCKEHSALSYLI